MEWCLLLSCTRIKNMIFRANSRRFVLETGATAEEDDAEMGDDDVADKTAGGFHNIHCFST
jgi:hypothetical protein